MRESIINLDGTRPFIPSSSGFAKLPDGWAGSWPDNMPTGVYSGGPYTWKDPKDYYKRAIDGKDWVFKDETGLPSQPPYDIMHRIIPDLVWDKNLPFPLNNTWGYHDAATGNGRYDLYLEEMVKRFGKPSGMEEFCDKMQLMNAIGYQGIFEAAGHKLNDIGGVMLWKLNAAFPSVVWQVYDWYLQTNAGYYFMQNAIEPIHIQLNLNNLDVLVVNRSYKAVPGLVAQVDIFSLDSKSLFHYEKGINLPATSVQQSASLTKPLKGAQGVSFVVLNLKDNEGKIVSHNVYWLSKDDDFTKLNNMPETSLKVDVLKEGKNMTEMNWTIQITNPSDRIAFFIRPQIMADGNEVLPSFWSGSYFTLAPGENTTLKVSCPVAVMGSKNPVLKVSGWNVAEKEIKLGE
jgi:hypothetical protein